MEASIACIGSGNMGSALMRAASSLSGAENIGFTDEDMPKAANAAQAIGARVYASNKEAARNADVVFLAVKPQVLGAVLDEIAPVLKERAGKVLVSMAAGWSLAAIQDRLDPAKEYRQPLIRIMPNTPALIGQGLIALTASPEITEEKVAEVERMLGAAGIVDRIDERYFDAVTGLSGSGPAFVCLFIESLADGGVRAGLPRATALRYAAQTVAGTAAMIQETGKHPGELKDMVSSPAGTTIAGIAALENGAFRGTVMEAVYAAFCRSRALEEDTH
jgi:pyrroline-5-carboxylate reductase